VWLIFQYSEAKVNKTKQKSEKSLFLSPTSPFSCILLSTPEKWIAKVVFDGDSH